MVHNLALEEQEHTAQVRAESTKHRAELNAERARVDEELAHLETLQRDMEVDVSRYVLSMSPRPAKIVKIVGSQANFHLHQSA